MISLDFASFRFISLHFASFRFISRAFDFVDCISEQRACELQRNTVQGVPKLRVVGLDAFSEIEAWKPVGEPPVLAVGDG